MAVSARADLLVSTNGGAYMTSTSATYDEGFVTRSLPAGNFSFFGAAISSVDVNYDGYLDFSGQSIFNPPAMPSSGDGVIAACWDDLALYPGTGDGVIENTGPGYFAASWFANSYAVNDGHPAQVFQIALFGGDATVGGLAFHAGDIVFSYQSLDDAFRNGDISAGLNKGDGVGYALIPNSPAGGFYTNATLLPLMGPSYILFRPDGSGGYNSSIVGAPAVVVQTTNSLLPSGESTTFTSIVSGSGPITYQWYQDANAIPNATNSTLVLTNLSRTNSGAYTLVASNPFGNGISHPPARLTVIPPPSDLLVDPTGGTLLTTYPNSYDEATFTRSLGEGSFSLFGSSISTINVNANGYVNLTGSDGYAPKPLPFSGDGMISALMHDLAIYTAEGDAIMEKLGSGYYSVTWLASNYGSSGDGHPGLIFQIVLFGSQATVRGRLFNAGDIALSYGYLGPNAPSTVGLNKGDGSGYALVPDSPSNGILGIADQAALLPSEVGSYILFRPDGNGGYTVSLSTGQAAINVSPTSQSALAGNTVNLSVEAAGNEPLSYQWYKNSGSGPAPMPDATNRVLTLSNISQADQANYFVTVTNSMGADTSQAAVVTVTLVPTNLFLNPAGGTTLQDVNPVDEGNFLRALPAGAFSFFGQPITNVHANVNGYLDFSGLNYYQSVSWPYAADSMIALLVDDLVLRPASGGGIVENSGPGFYAITWLANSITSGAIPPNQIFQVILFGGDVTLNGIPFQAGDIVFDYGSLKDTFVGANATVGLNRTNSSTDYALVPGSPAGGVLADADKGLLLLDGHSAILFRPSAGGYTSMVVGGTKPVIALQPQGQTVAAESSPSFGIFASGAAPLAYQWFKNGTNVIPGATTNPLTLMNVHTNDTGDYTVIVTNSFGSATSQVAHLTVTNVPVAITAPPVGGFALAGANFSFGVGAFGTGPLSYQWLENGTPILQRTNASLTLTNVTPASSGSYSVLVSGASGTVASSLARLRVAQFAYVIPPDSSAAMSLRTAGMPLLFAAQAGLPVRLQFSTNLTQWSDLTNVTGTGGPMSFTDLSATNRPVGFYRIISP